MQCAKCQELWKRYEPRHGCDWQLQLEDNVCVLMSEINFLHKFSWQYQSDTYQTQSLPTQKTMITCLEICFQ